MHRTWTHRIIAVALAALLPATALASQTWTAPATLTAKGVMSTGTETAPSNATDGLDLSSIGGTQGGFSVVYESTASAFTACSLRAYLYTAEANAGAGLWSRAPDLDLSVQALTSQAFTGMRVVANRGRIAYAPSGCGQAGIVWITATASRG